MVFHISFFLLLILLPAQSALSSTDRIASESAFYLGGIQVNEPDQHKWVSDLKRSGMNTVSVTVYAWQGLWDSSEINDFEEDIDKVQEIRAAKSAGLNVILIMRVALQHAHPENRFLWHGMIMPKTDTDLNTWFNRYSIFVEKWAKIAEREGVDVFVIGSEMNALTATKPVSKLPKYFSYFEDDRVQLAESRDIARLGHDIDRKYISTKETGSYKDLDEYLEARKSARESWSAKVSYLEAPNRIERINERREALRTHWSELIERVREKYEGPVSYAANYDNYFEVDFWDDLDFIGINAYFSLRNSLGANIKSPGFEKDIEDRWGEILAEIENFRSENNIDDKRVIFTELGYTFRRHSTVYPWGFSGFILTGMGRDRDLLIWEEEPIDFEERALAIRALYNAYKNKPCEYLAGMLYWKFSTDKKHLDIEPFLVHLDPDEQDPALTELRKFLN